MNNNYNNYYNQFKPVNNSQKVAVDYNQQPQQPQQPVNNHMYNGNQYYEQPNLTANNLPVNNVQYYYEQPNNNAFVSKANNNVYNNQQVQKEPIENFTLTRFLIKKVYHNREKNYTRVLIQLTNREGFFIDSKFIRTDNFTLDFTIGIIPSHDYYIVVIGDKTAPQRKISGFDLINLIKQNIQSDNLNTLL